MVFMLVVATAIVFAEYQVRQEATARWVCLALIWLITVGMLLWLYSSA